MSYPENRASSNVPLDEAKQVRYRRMARDFTPKKLAMVAGFSLQGLGMILAGFPAQEESRQRLADPDAIERKLKETK